MGIKGKNNVPARKIAVLKELLKLAATGGMAKQSQDIFENAGQNPTTFRKEIYREELNLVNRFAVSANKQALLVQKLFEVAESGTPFTIAGIHESAGLAPGWSARCKDPSTHAVAMELRDLVESQPYDNHVDTLKRLLDEYEVNPSPIDLPSVELLNSRIERLKMMSEGHEIEPEPEEFSIAEPSDHMSASEVKAKIREHRRQSRESYFDHRPEMKLSPLPPISRQTSRQIAS